MAPQLSTGVLQVRYDKCQEGSSTENEWGGKRFALQRRLKRSMRLIFQKEVSKLMQSVPYDKAEEFVRSILDDQNIINSANNEDLPQAPILQVLNTKKLAAGQGSQDRYRIAVSDGVHYYTAAMLATQLNDTIQPGQVEPKAIIRLDRKVIIILELAVLSPASEVEGKIGEPQVLNYEPGKIGTNGDVGGMKTEAQPTGMNNNGSNSNQYKPNQPLQQQSYQNQPPRGGMVNGQPRPYGNTSGSSFYSGQAGDVKGARGNIHPISSLTPYQNRWTIQARVTNKSSIRTWSNSKGEGKLFNVDLIDKSGEIKATGFNEAVDKFYDFFETNKVYFISKGSLKTANKQYTSIKNDYEMYLNSDTVVELCDEKVDLPSVQFSFVDISNIENIPKDSLIDPEDVIGVVKSSSDLTQITTRSTNRQVFKRDVHLLDRSERTVQVTLWGSEAEKFEEHVDKSPVIAIKGAKVSDFGGRSLSVLGSSVMQVNPDMQEAHILRGWFDQEGKTRETQSISGHRSEGGGAGGMTKTCAQIKDDQLGMGEKPDYFTVRAACMYFKKDNCLYQACPSQDCNKKVIEDGGSYRCEKCNRTYPDFKYRMILQTNISDFSGSHWITCFQESGEGILGISADKLGNLKEQDEAGFENIFQEATFKTFNLKVRAKMETYNDETRLKCSCVGVSAIDFKQDSRRLLDMIKKLEV